MQILTTDKEPCSFCEAFLEYHYNNNPTLNDVLKLYVDHLRDCHGLKPWEGIQR